MKKVEKFKHKKGREPFSQWFDGLDSKVQWRIDAYIVRVAMGGAKKNVRRLTGAKQREIYEIKVDSGPAYRIYFAHIGTKIIVLLLGGTKRTQEKDVRLAAGYWREHVSK